MDDQKELKKTSEQVQYWLKEIADARKREKTFRKDGRKIVRIYEGKQAETEQYNILYTNTDTLAPALYNTTPRPVVQRRFKDADPVGGEASKVTRVPSKPGRRKRKIDHKSS